MKNKYKIVFDMILNIFSSAIPVVVIQVLLLPKLSKYFNSSDYGLVLTLISMLTIVSSTIGTVINNIKLIYNNKYEETNVRGDFSILLLIYEIINFVILLLLCIFYIKNISLLDTFLICVIGIMQLAKDYYIVAYRINLNYLNIFFNNIILAIGYIIGYVLFNYLHQWQLIYIIGLALSLIYILLTTNIVKEPLKKTKYWKTVNKELILLLIATFLARVVNYADKLLLFPLIGGELLAIYYVATLLGKIISMVITPINSVVLSYLSKINKKSNRTFTMTFVSGLIICIIGYILAILFSKPILSIIYSEYVDAAMKYIYITSATICVDVLVSLLSPFVLKFYTMKWQIVINGLTVAFYIIVSLLLFNLYGLTGFCIGTLLTNILKLVITLLIFYYKSERCDNIEKNS